MGRRHNDLIPHIEGGRTHAKKGAWTRKRIRARRIEVAIKLGHHKAPGARRAEREAKRQSNVQWFMRYMENVSRDDAARRKRYEREREERRSRAS